jgi:hypothetical protein
MTTVLKGTMLHSNARGLSQSGESMTIEGEEKAFYNVKGEDPKKNFFNDNPRRSK